MSKPVSLHSDPSSIQEPRQNLNSTLDCSRVNISEYPLHIDDTSLNIDRWPSQQLHIEIKQYGKENWALQYPTAKGLHTKPPLQTHWIQPLRQKYYKTVPCTPYLQRRLWCWYQRQPRPAGELNSPIPVPQVINESNQCSLTPIPSPALNLNQKGEIGDSPVVIQNSWVKQWLFKKGWKWMHSWKRG